MRALLSVEHLSKSFGALRAVDGVSFDVHQGQIKAVIGPNGAGKSSLFNLISGFDAPDDGSVVFKGETLGTLGPHRRVRKGISRTFQNTQLFDDLTVAENVMVALPREKPSLGQITGNLGRDRGSKTAYARSESERLLRFVGLEDEAEMAAGDLATGSRRLLEIARALASSPDLLMLDEPAAGLNGAETERLARMLFRIRDGGTTILIVEHDMGLVMRVSDEILVLDRGRKIAEGPPLLIQKDAATIAAYLGTDPEEVEM